MCIVHVQLKFGPSLSITWPSVVCNIENGCIKSFAYLSTIIVDEVHAELVELICVCRWHWPNVHNESLCARDGMNCRQTLSRWRDICYIFRQHSANCIIASFTQSFRDSSVGIGIMHTYIENYTLACSNNFNFVNFVNKQKRFVVSVCVYAVNYKISSLNETEYLIH